MTQKWNFDSSNSGHQDLVRAFCIRSVTRSLVDIALIPRARRQRPAVTYALFERQRNKRLDSSIIIYLVGLVGMHVRSSLRDPLLRRRHDGGRQHPCAPKLNADQVFPFLSPPHYSRRRRRFRHAQPLPIVTGMVSGPKWSKTSYQRCTIGPRPPLLTTARVGGPAAPRLRHGLLGTSLTFPSAPSGPRPPIKVCGKRFPNIASCRTSPCP